MWLINTTSHELEEFIPEQSPPYAILSHRWEDEEVLFRHMQNPGKAQARKGYQKLLSTCERAAADGLSYAWIDTCCINKDSSAELSEAINSMFEWYSKAKICYVYLSDVRSAPLLEDEFESSAWFTRGWTLQELIAPQNLVFLSSDWRYLGKREDMLELLVRITNIDKGALKGRDLSIFPVAMKMSWAAHRQTTRREDMAYSLLGIFGVNLPLLYGEGHRAFIRLQEEIISRNDDHSIFLWQQSTPRLSGIFAPSPSCFANLPFEDGSSLMLGDHFHLTNQGLSITLRLRPWIPQVYVATPDFLLAGSGEALDIFLCQVSKDDFRHWNRIHDETLVKSTQGTCRRWRGWHHAVYECDSRRTRLVVGEKIIFLNNPLLSANLHCERILRQRYGFIVRISRSLDSFIREVTVTRLVSGSSSNLSPQEAYEVVSGPFSNKRLKANLQPGEYGMALMLETYGEVGELHRIGLGVDFEGIPFLIATQRRSRNSNYISEPRNLNQERTDSRAVDINLLIDEDFAQVNTTADRVVPGRSQDQWIRTSVNQRNAGRPTGHYSPSQNGLWAFKGTVIEATIRTFSRDRDIEGKRLLKIVLGRNVSRYPDTPYAVDLTIMSPREYDLEREGLGFG